ncbi:hypothetical protein OAE84_01120, partial [bacterium]|nr:hypothetical protein [bacterium]
TRLQSSSEFIVPAGKELRITEVFGDNDGGYCQIYRVAGGELVNDLRIFPGGSMGYQFATPLVFSEGEMLTGDNSGGNCYALGILGSDRSDTGTAG